MAERYHADVSFDNVKEGLVTSADASSIPFNALAEAINVDITSVGTIRTRDTVFNLIGEDDETVGEVLEIHQSGVFDITGIEDPLECNKDALKVRGKQPKALLGADGNPKLAFLVSRAVNDDSAGEWSRIDSLAPNMTWQKIDLPYELKGHHHHNLVDQLGRTYVSNNETDLQFIAVTGDSDSTNYNYNFYAGFPSCNTEFEIGTQALTNVLAVPSTVKGTYEGSINIGQGLIGCSEVWEVLIDTIKTRPPWFWDLVYLIQDGNWDANNPGTDQNTNVVGHLNFDSYATSNDVFPSDDEIRNRAMSEFSGTWPGLERDKILYQLVSHRRVDATNKFSIKFYVQAIEGQCAPAGVDQTEFEITNLSAKDPCDRTIYFDENPGVPPSGLYSHIAISFERDGQTLWYCPAWCCNNSARLAEGIRGNLLDIDDNRLFISDGQKINYSASGFYNGWESGNARYLGNFFPKGIFRLGSDAGIIDFPRDGKTISSIINYENDLYAHRGGSVWKIVQAEGMGVATPTEQTSARELSVPYFDRVRINSLGSADFIRAALDGDDFQFWVSSKNSTMVAYGLYPTLAAPTSKVVSFKIDGTVRKMDLSRAALLRQGDTVLLSGKLIDEKDCEEVPNRMFAQAKEKVINNVTLSYSKAFDLWTQIDRGFSMFYAGKDGNAYAGGYHGEVWRLDKNGRYDDGRIREDGIVDTTNATKIATRIKYKNADFGSPNLPKNGMGIWVEGWVGSGDPVEMGVVLDQTTIYDVKVNTQDLISSCANACTNLRGRLNSQYFSAYLQLPADTTFLRMQPFVNREDGYLEIVSVTPVLPKDSVENDLTIALETGTAVTICLKESRQ